ncbi:MAG: DUF2244 domain-containing protein [Pseudoprimorskyibacter sp.]|jgi:uncharacterized membrane protein|nr:DUF2244 domain-containing protein [Pseudoprimorskyibacter sp.]
MPYTWTDCDAVTKRQRLHLWPHNALPGRGFATFVLITFGFMSLPLVAVVGTMVLWGLLPFMMLALAGIWVAIRSNQRSRHILEVLELSPDRLHLTRRAPQGQLQEWEGNPYWTEIICHQKGGPVPHYITLKGAGREVEIGSFLSEEERLALYDELHRKIGAIAH